MTDTETICACITACWSASMTVIGYWLKKRKQVSVVKTIRVNVESDKLEEQNEKH